MRKADMKLNILSQHFQKSIDILGFEHKTNLKEGLTEMWEWAKQQPMRERFVWPNYELNKGIYSFWKS